MTSTTFPDVRYRLILLSCNSMQKMLYEKEFVEIGQIRRAHGYKGHAKIHVEDRYMPDLKEQKFVFIGVDGYEVPFAIDDIAEGRDVLLKLNKINSSEELNRYHLAPLYLLKEDLNHAKSAVEQEGTMLSMEGMTLIDETTDSSYTIERIDEYPSQLMAVVIKDGDEKLIPLHPDLIVSMDQEQNQVVMSLPEGLLD